MNEKLYIITRADLPAGAMLAQSVHAMRLFVATHPEVDREWYELSNNLVCLCVPDEPALERLRDSLQSRGIPVAAFQEPDFKDALTALAAAPDAWRWVSDLPLALRDAA